MATGLKTYKVNLPNEIEATATLPDNLDSELVEMALQVVLGGLVALSKATAAPVRRDFLIRYLASVISNADTALHSVAMSNSVENSNQKKIIDELLENLDHDK
jgi:hypothetical protein